MAFKDSQLTNPTMIRNLNPDASSVDLFKSFPFLSTEEICNLKAELLACLAKVEDLDDTVGKLSWWKSQETSLPNWCTVVKKIDLCSHPQQL